MGDLVLRNNGKGRKLGKGKGIRERSILSDFQRIDGSGQS